MFLSIDDPDREETSRLAGDLMGVLEGARAAGTDIGVILSALLMCCVREIAWDKDIPPEDAAMALTAAVSESAEEAWGPRQ